MDSGVASGTGLVWGLTDMMGPPNTCTAHVRYRYVRIMSNEVATRSGVAWTFGGGVQDTVFCAEAIGPH